ncbi:hypothetical protein [Paenibacillus pseudetheri]|uniref:Uncharacterized protein n=1 Tax=Paenibacillus pseudetheri TaxID=2897682 RepID=A0ABM9B8X3_9BACL|nr:hypothetical protein [Paenibacillus pseudetheri]CAH1055094.1 hypothetical protein PAECIP111894_01244 [Paenibacillus pseudetheri]
MKKELTRDVIRYSFIPISIIVFGLVIYPGLYKYDKLDQSLPVKINRITGNTKILTLNGWQDANDYDYASNLFYEYKRQVIDAMEEQNDSIKNSVMDSVLIELENAKNQIINTANSEEINPTYADGTSVFNSVRDRSDKNKLNSDSELLNFGLGDTKETVKKSMGTPSSIINSGDTWFYGSSMVNFKEGVVEGWNDPLNELHLR